MRGWHKALLTGLVLLLLLTAGTYWYLQKTLSALPLHNLKYHISGLSLRQLHLSHVSFGLEHPKLQVQLNDIRLSWQFVKAKLTQVQLGSADISLLSWPTAEDENTDSTTPDRLGLPSSWQLPAALPDNIVINSLTLHLPCHPNRCSYILSAALQNTAQQLQYQLSLADVDSPEQTRFSLSGDYRTVQQLPQLNAKVTLENSTQLQLSQQLSTHDGLNASGELTLNIAPPSPWLLQQFKLWQLAIPDEALAQFTTPVAVRSNWQLQLPAEPTLANIAAQAGGNWQLVAELPSPLTLPGFGQLQGNVTAELGLAQGELSRYQLNSQLQLLQPPTPGELLPLGIHADVLHIALTADGQHKPQLTALPLHIQLGTQGVTALNLTADATLNLTPPISAQLRNGKLDISQQQLTPAPDIQLDKLQLRSQFNAYWLADSWQLDIQSANADIAQLTAPDTTAQHLSLALTNGRFSGDSAFTNATHSADVKLTLAELKHPALKPLSWQWQAELNGSLSQLNLDARLSNSASLGLTHQLNYHKTDPQTETLQLNWQLEDMFLLAGNPLADTVMAWPALLEFNRGRLAGSGELKLLPRLDATAQINLSGVSGIFDRSLFQDLTAALLLGYQGDQLHLSTTEASLAQLRHGIAAGPLTLTAQYHASAEAITAGKLDIQQMQLQAMGGHVQLVPQLLDFALAEQKLQLELKQIDISQLLQQHPSSDISGNGRISGTIPLLLGRNGVSVENGFIAAESPGGKLQYRPPTAQSMAATNPGMKVMLDAMDDFHYTVLASNVSYDTNGKLLLALQLQGKNPALEAGRPINLTINLEEDLPALITSLQLNSKLSDKIKQRIQQKLQQSGAMRANGAQP